MEGMSENEGKNKKGRKGRRGEGCKPRTLAIVSVELSYSELSVVPWVLLGASWPQGSANHSLSVPGERALRRQTAPSYSPGDSTELCLFILVPLRPTLINSHNSELQVCCACCVV